MLTKIKESKSNFSFSGVKTSLYYLSKRLDEKLFLEYRHDIAASYQEAIIDALIEKIEYISNKMNKIPIECNDSPGFISNRILMPMINEAIFCLHEEVGTPEAIDSIMKLGMSHPMGPLSLADLIGLDVCLNIINVLFSDLCDDKYKPCPLLVKMVEEGHLGQKSGKGFYNYN